MNFPGTPARSAGRSRLLLIAALGLSLPACGSSGPPMGSVSGKITYQGKPVTQGAVTFSSTTPSGRNATGQIDPGGYYTVQTENPGDGALVGDYAVTIYAHDEPVLDYIPKTPVKPKLLVPEKYEKVATSGLKASVKGGSNTFNFDLTD